jgi:hypothetical protein
MSHLFLEVLGGGFTDQWSHHYLFNISSGAVYYIFILSWGFLRGGYHPPLFSSVLVMDHQVCHHSDQDLWSRLVTQTLDRTQVFITGGVLGEPQRTIPPTPVDLYWALEGSKDFPTLGFLPLTHSTPIVSHNLRGLSRHFFFVLLGIRPLVSRL